MMSQYPDIIMLTPGVDLIKTMHTHARYVATNTPHTWFFLTNSGTRNPDPAICLRAPQMFYLAYRLSSHYSLRD